MDAATQIVELQNRLNSVHMGNRERIRLAAEQRNLWDKEFPGAPFESVARISEWMVRK